MFIVSSNRVIFVLKILR